jgi:phenylacetic acid degradation protein
LRGDFGRITMMTGSNIQDSCVVHGFPGGDAIIEEDGHVGHGSVIHGATIGRNALIGINAVIMDNAVIGESAVVGAMAFVRDGTVIPPRMLAMGIPAKVVRELSEQEMQWKRGGTMEYQRLTRRSLGTQRRVTPLAKPQADRPRFMGGTSKTLRTVRAGETD